MRIIGQSRLESGRGTGIVGDVDNEMENRSFIQPNKMKSKKPL